MNGDTPFIQHPVGDTVAAGAIIASLMGWLPAIAAGCAILWYLILFGEKIVKWWGAWKRRGAPPSASGNP